MWFIHSTIANIQLLVGRLSLSLFHVLPKTQSEKRNCHFDPIRTATLFQKELPVAFQETPVHFQEEIQAKLYPETCTYPPCPRLLLVLNMHSRGQNSA